CATRRDTELTWIGFGVSDQFWNRPDRNGWIDFEDVGKADETRDGCDVADEIEIEFFVHGRVGGVRRTEVEKRIAVRRRVHGDLGAQIAPGARSILDDEWCAKPFRHPLTNQTCDDVAQAGGRKRDNDAYGPGRVGLRPCDTRDDRQHDSASGQMQEASSVGKFHESPSHGHSRTTGKRARLHHVPKLAEGPMISWPPY